MITLSKITFPRRRHYAAVKTRALRMLADGLRPKIIAQTLGVHPTTVRNWGRNK